MKRYSHLLLDAYRENGRRVRLLEPPCLFTRAGGKETNKKWLSYIDKFIVFPLYLRAAIPRRADVHIADHSDAIWRLALPRRNVVSVTCHDLFAVRAALGEMSEYRPGLLGRTYQKLVLAGLRRTRRIYAVSELTAGDVTRLTGHVPKLLRNPLDPRFLQDCGAPKIDSDYMLIVSSTGWRKRREAAILAWTELRKTPALKDAKLVIVGPGLTHNECVEFADQISNIVTVEDVSDGDLRTYYKYARSVIVLSRYEGFGWPVLEAQAFGKKPLVTDGPTFRETAGDGAVFIDPDSMHRLSPSEWTRIACQLCDPDQKWKATQNVQRFSWTDFVSSLRHADNTA